jgi:hypothetical protein
VIPRGVRERSVQEMLDRGRTPTYAVQTLAPARFYEGEKNPIHNFVSLHYEVDADVHGFRIWRLAKDPASASAELSFRDATRPPRLAGSTRKLVGG